MKESVKCCFLDFFAVTKADKRRKCTPSALPHQVYLFPHSSRAQICLLSSRAKHTKQKAQEIGLYLGTAGSQPLHSEKSDKPLLVGCLFGFGCFTAVNLAFKLGFVKTFYPLQFSLLYECSSYTFFSQCFSCWKKVLISTCQFFLLQLAVDCKQLFVCAR